MIQYAPSRLQSDMPQAPEKCLGQGCLESFWKALLWKLVGWSPLDYYSPLLPCVCVRVCVCVRASVCMATWRGAAVERLKASHWSTPLGLGVTQGTEHSVIVQPRTCSDGRKCEKRVELGRGGWSREANARAVSELSECNRDAGTNKPQRSRPSDRPGNRNRGTVHLPNHRRRFIRPFSYRG